MMKRFALAFALMAVPAMAADLPIKEDMPYSEARASMIASGWEPVPQPDTPGRCSGLDDICEAYPEVEDCAGSGLAPCAFVFSFDGQEVRLTTVGETDPIVSGWFVE